MVITNCMHLLLNNKWFFALQYMRFKCWKVIAHESFSWTWPIFSNVIITQTLGNSNTIMGSLRIWVMWAPHCYLASTTVRYWIFRLCLWLYTVILVRFNGESSHYLKTTWDCVANVNEILIQIYDLIRAVPFFGLPSIFYTKTRTQSSNPPTVSVQLWVYAFLKCKLTVHCACYLLIWF